MVNTDPNADADVRDVRQARLLLRQTSNPCGTARLSGVRRARRSPGTTATSSRRSATRGSGWSGPGSRTTASTRTTWTDHTNLRPTIMYLTGLKDDYTEDGHVLVQALDPKALNAGPERPRRSAQLEQADEQLNAPFGDFANSTLASSTKALESTDADDATYTSIEGQIASLTTQRDALANTIRQALNDAAFNGGNITNAQAQGWIIVGECADCSGRRTSTLMFEIARLGRASALPKPVQTGYSGRHEPPSGVAHRHVAGRRTRGILCRVGVEGAFGGAGEASCLCVLPGARGLTAKRVKRRRMGSPSRRSRRSPSPRRPGRSRPAQRRPASAATDGGDPSASARTRRRTTRRKASTSPTSSRPTGRRSSPSSGKLEAVSVVGDAAGWSARSTSARGRIRRSAAAAGQPADRDLRAGARCRPMTGPISRRRLRRCAARRTSSTARRRS